VFVDSSICPLLMTRPTRVLLQIYAKDAASAEKLSSTLGTGSGALDKINSELQKQGLEKSTGLDVVSANKSDNTGLIVGTRNSFHTF